MVDRCYTSGYISAGLNNQRHGGRVPPQRKSLECFVYRRLSGTRRHCRAGTLDVNEGTSLRQEGELG